MTRWENYLAAAEKVILEYDGGLPLHHFLKGFFKQHPYMGSRDRRHISQLVYAHYRLGYLYKEEMSVQERIQIGLHLCRAEESENFPIPAPLNIPLDNIFPFKAALSPDIDPIGFSRSFLRQPFLFIRTRKGKQDAIKKLLQRAEISFEEWGPTTLALPNSTKIDTIVTDKSWYEIQDASSQQVGHLFHPKPGEQWWDSCAASGGKSILLLDQEPKVKLMVSDVRSSIISNLHMRFKEAGIRDYTSMVMDLTAPIALERRFDNIILDAPCSGSGTWGRTPENLSFFREEQIKEYQQLQQTIAGNVVKLLKPGGSLIYITCSVFRQENEEVVAHVENTTGLKKQEGGVIAGYEKGADSMFAVRLT
ncbi:RsmB/NOP family class I SAM-dependent RNA methyltransferase [Chitinophaga sancti]|uniref:RsmB/NOP family class I SAM-dependent RNA methyltransferase n=1 Tax=Chitinophaga sancti TaxID=1004 RepID=UPI002A756930|nr:RsmB/NOP family class I SAM-dependent RNA methyltransferase [Chitinophaga sancti]WPQ62801.1 RsmB/NOP family class I SAM-dependent RNA methyltransferase [Chitinophaga sancti]